MKKVRDVGGIPIGSSLSNPVPPLVPVKIKIEQGDLYGVPDLYELELSTLKILKGKRAIKEVEGQVKDKSLISDKEDYVLVLLQARYSAYGKSSGLQSYEIGENEFSIFTENMECKPSRLSLALNPRFIGTLLNAGETKSGWIAFEVPKNLRKAFLLFRHQNPQAVQRSRLIWFKLY